MYSCIYRGFILKFKFTKSSGRWLWKKNAKTMPWFDRFWHVPNIPTVENGKEKESNGMTIGTVNINVHSCALLERERAMFNLRLKFEQSPGAYWTQHWTHFKSNELNRVVAIVNCSSVYMFVSALGATGHNVTLTIVQFSNLLPWIQPS